MIWEEREEGSTERLLDEFQPSEGGRRGDDSLLWFANKNPYSLLESIAK
jgi:hypothetical protein